MLRCCRKLWGKDADDGRKSSSKVQQGGKTKCNQGFIGAKVVDSTPSKLDVFPQKDRGFLRLTVGQDKCAENESGDRQPGRRDGEGYGKENDVWMEGRSDVECGERESHWR